MTPAWLMIPARLLSDVRGNDRADSCIKGASMGHVPLGATKAAIQQGYPQYRVIDAEIPLEAEERSAAVQVQRAVENLVTAELSEAGRAWRITTEHPMFKTARALGSARPSTLSCVPHGKPKSFQFPEGALIALYHFRDSVVAFQVDADSTVFFKKHQHHNGESHSHRGDGAVRRKGKAVLTT